MSPTEYGPARLGDDVHRPGGEGFEAGGRSFLRHRADDDHRQRAVDHELSQEGQTVHARHLDVERQHVRLVLENQIARDEGIRCEADDLDVGFVLQRIRQHPPHDGGVVDDEHTCLSHRSGHRQCRCGSVCGSAVSVTSTATGTSSITASRRGPLASRGDESGSTVG